MKIVFLGTPAFAVFTLRALHAAGHEVVLVVSQPDRPSGRGQQMRPPPVKEAALALGLPVYQPEDVNSEAALETIAALKPDAIVVTAFGQFLKKKFRGLAPHCLNVHASLLPRLRGAAPINRAIMEGDPIAGVTIMKVEARMDAGDMYLKGEIPVGPLMTAGDLHDALAPLGGRLMVETLTLIQQGAITPQPQDNARATHAPKIESAEALIDWTLPAEQLDRRIRGLSPAPGAYTFHNGKRVVAVRSRMGDPSARGTPGSVVTAGPDHLEVYCGNGTVALLEVRPEGKKTMGAADWARGARVGPGSCLGNT